MNMGAKDGLERSRSQARARFEVLGYPTPRHEDWRFTNVAPIARGSFGKAPRLEGPLPEPLEALLFPEVKGSVLAFVNGHFEPGLSTPGLLPDGVLAGGLHEALRLDPECVRTYLGQFAGFEDQAFTALNLAELGDGAFVYVPGGLVLDEPIHMVHLSVPGAEPTATHPRNLIVLQRGSSAKLIESYAGLDGGSYFTNAVTEIALEHGAIAEHVRLQREGAAGLHVARTAVRQGRDSHYRSVSISLGGLLARHDLGVVLDGEGAGCSLDGLYLAAERQHVDNHTCIDHALPHCSSQEMYKGVLGGKASGVFNGKVIVRKDARKTDAHQTNKNLLISETAVIDTKPELEIYNDDVKCTHGATIGQLDEDSVFYLRSRGISLEDARSVLVYAFASEVLGRIRVPAVRQALEQQVLEWFGKNQGRTA